MRSQLKTQEREIEKLEQEQQRLKQGQQQQQQQSQHDQLGRSGKDAQTLTQLRVQVNVMQQEMDDLHTEVALLKRTAQPSAPRGDGC